MYVHNTNSQVKTEDELDRARLRKDKLPENLQEVLNLLALLVQKYKY
jgi:hypothetical protein